MQIKEVNQIDFSKLNKKIILVVPAQNAKLGPPVGAVLGQAKIKVKDFCSLFNEYTKKFQIGLPLRVFVYVYKNDSFDFIVSAPSTTFLLKNFINMNRSKKLNLLSIFKIALIKHQERQQESLRVTFRNVINIALRMGIIII